MINEKENASENAKTKLEAALYRYNGIFDLEPFEKTTMFDSVVKTPLMEVHKTDLNTLDLVKIALQVSPGLFEMMRVTQRSDGTSRGILLTVNADERIVLVYPCSFKPQSKAKLNTFRIDETSSNITFMISSGFINDNIQYCRPLNEFEIFVDHNTNEFMMSGEDLEDILKDPGEKFEFEKISFKL